jgi:putative transposase
MIGFIDDYRGAYGVEPICRVLKIAPSTYHAHDARRRRPDTAPPRVPRDAALRVEIRRVFDENFQVYGVRKVWRPLVREGEDVARCTVARLMRGMGLQGRHSRKTREDDDQRQGRAMPAGPCEPPVPGATPERAVGLGLYVRRHQGGLRLGGVRHRRLRSPYCRLAGQPLGSRRLRSRRLGAGAS